MDGIQGDVTSTGNTLENNYRRRFGRKGDADDAECRNTPLPPANRENEKAVEPRQLQFVNRRSGSRMWKTELGRHKPAEILFAMIYGTGLCECVRDYDAYASTSVSSPLPQFRCVGIKYTVSAAWWYFGSSTR